MPLARVTAELYTLPLEAGRWLVYAPLRRAAFIGNATVVRSLAALQAGAADASSEADQSLEEFLRRLEILDAGPEVSPLERHSGEPEPVMVTLLLTTACNLRCDYCYASAGQTPVRSMPLEVARQGIDFVARNAQKLGCPYFEVSYHGGGEPTLNWRTLTASLAYAREKAAETGLELKNAIATNGVLTDAQIDWMIANLQSASISYDGLPEVHDRHRLTPAGGGSSARVIHTLRRLDQTGYSYGLRVTVTADQIAPLPDSIEFIATNFRPNGVQVEPVYQLGRWQAGESAETGEFIAAYREAQERARRHGREISFSAARLGLLTNHFCGLSRDSFCLAPDGGVTACYEVFGENNRWAKYFFYGRPEPAAGGYRFDRGVLDHLRAQAVEYRRHCQDCFAKWTCAGDCYHKSLEWGGEGEFAGAGRCHVTRELTKDLILERIAASGGLFWHEGSQAAPTP